MNAPLRAYSKAFALSAGLVNSSILLYSLWLLLPAVQTTGGAAAGAFCVGLFALGVLLDGSYLRQEWGDFLLRVFSAAALPLVFWFFLRRGAGHFLGYYLQQGMFWFPLLYCAYARKRQDSRLWRFLFGTVLVCLAITTMTTIGWLVQGILRGGKVYAYSRSLGSAEPGREAYLKELMLRNIGGYDFVYATVLSLPITWYAMLCQSGRKKLALALFLCLQVVMVMLSQYTYGLVFTAVLMFVEGLGLFARNLSQRLGKRQLSVGVSFLWGALPLALCWIFRTQLVAGLAALCGRIGFTNVAYSLEQLLNILTGNGVDAASRLDYYRLPLQGIRQSPFVGSLLGNPFQLSQHSDVLDLLSGVGVIGAALVGLMVVIIGRGLCQGLTKSEAFPHFVLQWMAFAACAILGTVTYSRDISLVLCVSVLLALEKKSFGFSQ